MYQKIKKILFRKITIPPPETLISKKALLLILVIFSLSYDILILSSVQLKVPDYPVQNKIYSQSPLNKNIRALVAGYPIEKMVSYISAEKKSTAAFLVGIAKKESNWGKYSPKLNGKDCYNYWGYRGQSENMTPSGYTCFKNPRQAVSIVSQRINELADDSGLNTPKKMIVWKCGWDCTGHSNQSVAKWVADVSYYYKKVYQ